MFFKYMNVLFRSAQKPLLIQIYTIADGLNGHSRGYILVTLPRITYMNLYVLNEQTQRNEEPLTKYLITLIYT